MASVHLLVVLDGAHTNVKLGRTLGAFQVEIVLGFAITAWSFSNIIKAIIKVS